MRREFLLLADTFKADKHDPIGMIASEKLDGNRCFWDGGVSRGDDTVNVPWASVTNPKTGEPKDKVKPKATGLWSRYGNPIQAPDWFLDSLPPEPLDGELYLGRGKFQETQSIVRRDDCDHPGWKDLKFVAFGAPTYGQVFQDGLIKNANMLCEIDHRVCYAYIADRQFPDSPLDAVKILAYYCDQEALTYEEELDTLSDYYSYYGGDSFSIVDTWVVESFEQLDVVTKQICANDGEGVMLREPGSVWFPKRRPFLLKVKPRHDAEATIVGFFAGRKGKTGQFLGKLGGLVCVWHGDPTAPCGLLKAPVEFEVGTGLTHADRALYCPRDEDVACSMPGERIDGRAIGQTAVFKIGDRITFSYMGVTNDCAPREPAYLRLRDDV